MGYIRIILALSVVIAHAGPWFGVFELVGGKVAVEAFFIISGFYMSLILNEKYNKPRSYSLFITNRMLKLYPIYWVILIFTFLASIFSMFIFDNAASLAPYIDIHKEMSLISLIVAVMSNISLIGQDILMFLELDNGSLRFTSNFLSSDNPMWHFLLIPPAWSISLELLFYLIAPFIVRKRLSFLVLISILSLMLKVYILGVLEWKNDPWTYRFFPTELAYFLGGAISYKLLIIVNKYKLSIQQKVGKIAFVVILLYTVGYEFILIPEVVKQYIYYGIFLLSIPFIFQWSKTSKKDRFIGELSYPVYISHLLVLTVLSSFGLNTFSWFSLLVALCTIIFSFLLVLFVMNPIDSYRQGRVNTVSEKKVA